MRRCRRGIMVKLVIYLFGLLENQMCGSKYVYTFSGDWAEYISIYPWSTWEQFVSFFLSFFLFDITLLASLHLFPFVSVLFHFI